MSVSLFGGIQPNISIRTGYTIIDMFNVEQRNKYGSKMVNRPPIISEELLTILKEEYLDKLLCKQDSSLSGRIGSFQKLMIIIREIKNIDTHNDYDILITEVMALFTSLLYKSQSQYVKIKLQERKITNINNLLKIKNEEIESLKLKLKACEGNLSTSLGFSGSASFEVLKLPDQLLFLMQIDIVKAWYYYIFGVPGDCDILDPDNLNYIFSYLAENFNNLRDAQNGLRNALKNDENNE